MKSRILLTESIRPGGLDLLTKNAEVIIAPDPSSETAAAMISDFDGLIARNTYIGKEVLLNARRLKVIASHGTGTDHIDIDAATQQGICVVNTPGANAESVAETVVGLMLAISRKLIDGDIALRLNKDYYYRNQCLGDDLFSKTISIIGMGQIGQKLARICLSGFNMKVQGYDPYLSAEKMRDLGVTKFEAIDELLSNADYISLNCPYYDNLYHMIDARRLALMKSTAYLINCARGQLIDENALCVALRSGIIGGAALDVYKEEPPKHDDPLFLAPNLIMTPHIAAFAQDSIDNMSLVTALDVLHVLNGEATKAHVVNLKALGLSTQ